MIFTGTSAIDMAKGHARGGDWRIFSFKQYNDTFQMMEGTWVLYQIEVICYKVIPVIELF